MPLVFLLQHVSQPGYSSRRRGFMGNQPFITRSRCSKISLMVQNEENPTTPARVERNTSDIASAAPHMAMPRMRNHHQHRVPK